MPKIPILFEDLHSLTAQLLKYLLLFCNNLKNSELIFFNDNFSVFLCLSQYFHQIYLGLVLGMKIFQFFCQAE